MKLKYYLRGIGIGVIVTTVILMIAFFIHKEQPLTDDEIRERATELGMVMPEQLSGGDKLSDSDVTPQKEEDADVPETNGKDDVGTQQPDPESEDAKADAADKKEEPKVVEQVEISIVGGEYSDDVCKKLEEAGVIDDAEDFNKYLSEGGFDNLIQPGTYVLESGADYDSIIEIITKKN